MYIKIDAIKKYFIMILLILLALFVDVGFQYYSINCNLTKIECRLHNIEEQQKNIQPINPPKYRYVTFILKTTAYSSSIDECDEDPFIGAWNNPVGPGMVATSRDLLKIGFNNKVPIIIDGKNCYIGDKMGKKKWTKKSWVKIRETLDIWMETKQEAKDYGHKMSVVQIPIDYIDMHQLFKRYKIRVEI